MATVPMTYFKADPNNLPAAYGGAALLTGRGSAELTAEDIFNRHVVKQLDWLDNGANAIGRTGIATDGFYWWEIPTALYTAISSLMVASQTSSATTTKPAGWAATSYLGKFAGYPDRTLIVIIGDSISVGQGADTPYVDHHICQAINLIAGETLVFSETNRFALSKSYCVMNIAISGSAYDGVDVYPENWMDAYDQHIKTLPACERMIIVDALGSNDITHNGNEAGSVTWAKAEIFLDKLGVDFPNAKIVKQTIIKRGETSAINTPITDLNALIRSDSSNHSVDYIMDVEANVPELNTVTGDTTDLTVYADGTHLVTNGYDLQVSEATAMLTAVNAMF